MLQLHHLNRKHATLTTYLDHLFNIPLRKAYTLSTSICKNSSHQLLSLINL